MKWSVTTPPACEPLEYAEAKAHTRVDTDDDRCWIEAIAIPAARATAEQECGLSLITQTLAATAYDHHDLAPGNMIRLPRGPVQSVTSVIDGNGNTVSAGLYSLRRIGLHDHLALRRDLKFPVTVAYVAGFGEFPEDVPARLRAAMLAHVTFLYDNRGADVEPTALDRIYRKYRNFAL